MFFTHSLCKEQKQCQILSTLPTIRANWSLRHFKTATIKSFCHLHLAKHFCILKDLAAVRQIWLCAKDCQFAQRPTLREDIEKSANTSLDRSLNTKTNGTAQRSSGRISMCEMRSKMLHLEIGMWSQCKTTSVTSSDHHHKVTLSEKRMACNLCACALSLCLHYNNYIESLKLCLCECNWVGYVSVYKRFVCAWVHTQTCTHTYYPNHKRERGLSSPWPTFSRVAGSSMVWSMPRE